MKEHLSQRRKVRKESVPKQEFGNETKRRAMEMETIKKAGVRITVRGRVQGVGFRYFIYHEAENLGLTGYAKNLFNGDVEVCAEGRKEFLEELVRKVKTGPSGAHVTGADVEWLEFKDKYDNFDVR